MFSFNINAHKFNHVHFVGIGGISMSGLAEILLEEGYEVSGSDMNPSFILEKLKNQGAKIYIGHKGENVGNADLVVYTDAIPSDNPELLEAKKRGIETADRGTFLGKLMNNYKNSIAVSGTHGKTTTTSMIATILNRSTINPTILLGGELDEINGNVKIGDNDLILTEACEYKGNILKYSPTMAIILNMEEDHLDYFKDINHIVDTFSQYARGIREDGYLVINIDDKNSKKVIDNVNCNIITFGINTEADFVAQNISFSKEGYPNFMLNIRGENLYPVKLNVMGIHNIYNALASIAATATHNIPIETIIKSIEDYKGTHRRLEFKGYYDGFKIIDDYAHHPTEIKATLNTLKMTTDKKIWCVFQPHTYTRTKLLLDKFSEAFYDANTVIVTDIYAAREIDTGLIHSKDLVKRLNKNGINAIYIPDFEKIKDYLIENVNKGDIVITMGAGNIYKVGEMILEEKEKKAI